MVSRTGRPTGKKSAVGAADPGEVVPLRPARRCPICGKPAVRAFYPFDSKRCADIDLAKWMGGGYAIPAVEAEGEREGDDGDNAPPRHRDDKEL